MLSNFRSSASSTFLIIILSKIVSRHDKLRERGRQSPLLDLGVYVIRELSALNVVFAQPSAKLAKGHFGVTPRFLWIGEGLTEIFRVIMIPFHAVAVLLVVALFIPKSTPMLTDANIWHERGVDLHARLSKRDNHVGNFFEYTEIPGRHRVICKRNAVVELTPRVGNIVVRIVTDLRIDEIMQRLPG